MKNFLAMILSGVGMFAATISTSACPIVWMDEPSMPNKMIEK